MTEELIEKVLDGHMALVLQYALAEPGRYSSHLFNLIREDFRSALVVAAEE